MATQTPTPELEAMAKKIGVPLTSATSTVTSSEDALSDAQLAAILDEDDEE